MKAAILTIGDEILLGQILDTNSQYIARELTQLGAQTVQMRSVADTQEAILQALTQLTQQADVVIITGGLGPTRDDMTKNALAEFFHTQLVFNPQVYSWLEEMFAAAPARLNAYNKTQALLPANCLPLRNIKGTACGMWFEQDGKIIVSLPGVPFETQYLLPAEVLPRLKEKFTDLTLSYRLFTVFGITEADLAMRLAAFEDALPSDISLAYLPSAEYIRLRLTTQSAGETALDNYGEKLRDALGGLSFTEGELAPTQHGVSLLAQQGYTVACAESCTGGNIAHLITQFPGASAYFLGGVVAYANEVKTNVLGVRAEDIAQHGAVSETVALQMARGVRQITGADFAVATTGVAGPAGGTPQKPVGTVWIAVAGPHGATAEKFLFSTTRERNIAKASLAAVRLLLQAMQAGPSRK